MSSESEGIESHLLIDFSGVAATFARNRHLSSECQRRNGRTGPRRGGSVAEFAEHVRESAEKM